MFIRFYGIYQILRPVLACCNDACLTSYCHGEFTPDLILSYYEKT